MPGLRRNFRASTAASACAGQFVNEAQAAVVNFRIALVLVVGLAGCAGRPKDPDAPALHTVDHVDLDRYLGTWYEIASYPQRFQRGCTATTAIEVGGVVGGYRDAGGQMASPPAATGGPAA